MCVNGAFLHFALFIVVFFFIAIIGKVPRWNNAVHAMHDSANFLINFINLNSQKQRWYENAIKAFMSTSTLEIVKNGICGIFCCHFTWLCRKLIQTRFKTFLSSSICFFKETKLILTYLFLRNHFPLHKILHGHAVIKNNYLLR